MALPIPSIWWAEERVIDIASAELDATLNGTPAPSSTNPTLTKRVKQLEFDADDTQTRDASIVGNIPAAGFTAVIHGRTDFTENGYYWTIGFGLNVGWRFVVNTSGVMTAGFNDGDVGIHGIVVSDAQVVAPPGGTGYFSVVVRWSPGDDTVTAWWRDEQHRIQRFIKTGVTQTPSYNATGTISAPGHDTVSVNAYVTGGVADWRLYDGVEFTDEQSSEYLRKYNVAELTGDFDRTVKSGAPRPVLGVEILPKGAVPQEDSLECWLRCSVGPGERIRDISGNGRDATFQLGGDAHQPIDGWTAGYETDGVDDFVDFGDFGWAGNSGTLAIWGSFGGTQAGPFAVAKHDRSLGPGGDENLFCLGRSLSNDRIRLVMHNNAVEGTDNSVPDDTPTTLIGTIGQSGSNTSVQLYVDGQIDTSSTILGALLSDVALSPTDTEWTLACDHDGTADPRDGFWNVNFGDVLIYNTRLSATEAEQLDSILRCHRFQAIYHESRWRGLPPSLLDINPIRASLDVDGNAFSLGGIELTIADDDWWRGIVEDYDVGSATVRLYLADERMESITAGKLLFEGFVEDWSGEDGRITVECLPGAALRLLETEVAGHWESLHPLEIFRDILDSIQSGLYDEESTDPYQPNLIDISHFNMTRTDQARFTAPGVVLGLGGAAGTNAVDGSVPARGLIESLAEPLPGAFVIDDAERWRFIRHDLDAAVNHAWTADDISSIRPTTMLSNRFNSLYVSIGIGLEDTTFYRPTDSQLRVKNIDKPLDRIEFEFDNADGISRWGRRITRRYQTEWLSQVVISDQLFSAVTPGEIQLLPHISPAFIGVCGAGFGPSARVINGTQDIWRTIDVDLGRVTYLIGSDGTRTNRRAIAKIINMEFSWANAGIMFDEFGQQWPMFGPAVSNGWLLDYEKSTFPEFGSGNFPVVFTDKFVYDLTIPAYFAEYALRRFADGAPKLEVRHEGLSQIDVEFGDTVTIDYEDIAFARNGVDGLTNTTKWQVTGKEIDPIGDQPGITFEVTHLRDDVGDPVVSATIGRTLVPVSQDLGTTQSQGEQSHVQTGVGSSSSGLTFTVEAGAIRSGNGVTIIDEDRDVTLQPNRDNYIYWDPFSAQLMNVDIPIGTGPPGVIVIWIELYRVETDGVGVVATETLFSSQALAGSALQDGSVTTLKLADDAVTQDKIADNSVGNAQMLNDAIDTAELVDLAVETAKLDNDAVTQDKIADNSVGNAQMLNDAIDTAELVDAAVETVKIADDNVTTAKLADDAVTPAKTANQYAGTVQTTDATPTTIVTIPLVDDTEYHVRADVSLQEDAQADGNAIDRKCWAYRRSGGSATLGAQTAGFSGQAYGTIAFAVSGNDLLLQVTGIAATTINWGAVVAVVPTAG